MVILSSNSCLLCGADVLVYFVELRKSGLAFSFSLCFLLLVVVVVVVVVGSSMSLC